MSQGSLLAGIEAARRNWGWFLALGLLLIVLGAATLPLAIVMTTVFVWFWGVSLLIEAGFYFAALFAVRGWDGFFIYLLMGLLSLFVGLFCVMHPVSAELQLTLILAILLVVGGSFRAISAAFLQYPGAIWSMLGGLIAILLGAAIWQRYPYDGLWFIGMMVSIDMIVQGASWVAVGLGLKSMPRVSGPLSPPTTPGNQPPGNDPHIRPAM